MGLMIIFFCFITLGVNKCSVLTVLGWVGSGKFLLALTSRVSLSHDSGSLVWFWVNCCASTVILGSGSYRTHDCIFLSHDSESPGSRVNCYWPSPAQSVLVLGPVGIHDHIFVLSKAFMCFEMGPSFNKRKGLTTTGDHLCWADTSRHLTNWPLCLLPLLVPPPPAPTPRLLSVSWESRSRFSKLLVIASAVVLDFGSCRDS
jgi:hypothetical protein